MKYTKEVPMIETPGQQILPLPRIDQLDCCPPKPLQVPQEVPDAPC
jgi:hypothetical protein